MASGQTQYYELNQWEGRDQVLRTEFNADNARIDRALHELRARNCQLYMLTYTGTGSGGRSFTFPHRPAAVPRKPVTPRMLRTMCQHSSVMTIFTST